MSTLRINCERCIMRGLICGDCVVSVLCGTHADIEFDSDERGALTALATVKLVPPLRMRSAGTEAKG